MVKDSSGGCKLTITEDSAPNTVNLLWLVPQFAVITVAEVLISVTGLEFAYTQERSKMPKILTDFTALGQKKTELIKTMYN